MTKEDTTQTEDGFMTRIQRRAALEALKVQALNELAAAIDRHLPDTVEVGEAKAQYKAARRKAEMVDALMALFDSAQGAPLDSLITDAAAELVTKKKLEPEDTAELEPEDTAELEPEDTAELEPTYIQMTSQGLSGGLARGTIIINPRVDLLGGTMYRTITRDKAKAEAARGCPVSRHYSRTPEVTLDE